MIPRRARRLARLPLAAAVLGGAFATDTADAQTARVARGPGAAQAGVAAPSTAADAVRRAEQRYLAGDFDGVVREADVALRQSDQNHQALYFRGSAKVELGLLRGDVEMVRGGIADARQAISLGGRTNSKYYLPYLYGMTNLSVMEDRPDHAEVARDTGDTVVSRANLDADTKANLLYQRALAKRYLEDTDGAVRDFADAVKLQPSHLGAAAARADALRLAGRTDDARAAYDDLVAGFPENPLVYNNRGMFELAAGDRGAAVEDFSRALRLDPDYHFALTNRGKASLDAGDTTAAIADFDRSLRIDPSQAGVFGFRGNAKLYAGDLRGAIADQSDAVRKAPTNPIAHSDLGFVLFFAGRYADALQQFDAALRLAPTYRHLHPWRLEALRETGGDPSGDPGITLALDNGGNGVDWVVRVLQFQLGRLTGEELLGKITSDDETAAAAQRCEAHYFIGRSREAAGDADGARDAYRLALETGVKNLSAYRGAKIRLGE